MDNVIRCVKQVLNLHLKCWPKLNIGCELIAKSAVKANMFTTPGITARPIRAFIFKIIQG